ncbi:FtsK/SpoIIIE domain-containing protein [Microlunatus sp. Gsoil 973]|uniref:FtsK/SpoIIIE domain-containing protein n=1 Tax=Microlunatus sp. Gsoil 973 TaxID=2672569 RepID=UPI0012B4C2AC|nr:FtsK/SpoIIIE domain-containing protein [Microlunatus sp. Gsoil 973]QGN34808.1 cell division protein FtsK [Microlunatus sp. Gsoil 973]
MIIVVGIVCLGLLPGAAGAVWFGLSPGSFERRAAGPWRRYRWRRLISRQWQSMCRDARLAERQMIIRRTLQGERQPVEVWRCPRLQQVRASAHAVELIIRARPGQTVAELEAGVERIASILDAVAFRSWPVSGSVITAELIMTDLLTTPVIASMPEAVLVDGVRLGRAQSGRDWWLPITGRHTLCVGCSGSGKGSILWGICAGLSPAVHADTVRLWGVDLKAGVELAMGRTLFSAFAKTPDDALRLLAVLAGILQQRGEVMAGSVRQHLPRPGDPLHVLVIDELAALTAYAPSEIRRDADRLLSLILTQGRALGVVVVAFVQDPRKEIVAMRGLFTQTIALRLRSREETVMVLGEGMAQRAPAHRISPAGPGTGWLVEDTGQVDRVRADYWPDPLIRHVAHHYRARAVVDVSPASVPADDLTGDLTDTPAESATGRSGRRSRVSRRAGAA